VPHTPLDVSRFLLWLSALLLPLDVAVRRLALRREDVAPFVGAPAAALAWARRRRQAAPEAPATVAALLTHKRQGRGPVSAPRGQPAPPGEPAPGAAPMSETRPEHLPADTTADLSGEEREAEAGGSTTSRLLERKQRRRER
jgi:hypothetical protein